MLAKWGVLLHHMTDKLRAYFYLHICVFLWGFTAILGKLITLQALPLVWWRVVISCVTLWVVMPKAPLRALTRNQFWRLFGIGMVVGVHWLCFYGAIKLSNASVAVATMATASFFSALSEPLILKKKVKGYELALGIFILPGMALLVGNINWTYRLGFAVGVVGALLAAVFTAYNKKMLDEKHPPPPLSITLVELFGAVVVCSAALPFALWKDSPLPFWPQGIDWFWIFVLSWACTLFTYYLSLLAMRHLTAFSTNLTINLEPVYGVILSVLIFREDRELSPGFYIGVAIILLAVFSHPFLKWWVEKKQAARAAVS
jgi:drug/metabolite transporter (DMT)-like permease